MLHKPLHYKCRLCFVLLLLCYCIYFFISACILYRLIWTNLQLISNPDIFWGHQGCWPQIMCFPLRSDRPTFVMLGIHKPPACSVVVLIVQNINPSKPILEKRFRLTCFKCENLQPCTLCGLAQLVLNDTSKCGSVLITSVKKNYAHLLEL